MNKFSDKNQCFSNPKIRVNAAICSKCNWSVCNCVYYFQYLPGMRTSPATRNQWILLWATSSSGTKCRFFRFQASTTKVRLPSTRIHHCSTHRVVRGWTEVFRRATPTRWKTWTRFRSRTLCSRAVCTIIRTPSAILTSPRPARHLACTGVFPLRSHVKVIP